MPREKVPCGNLLFLSWVQGELQAYLEAPFPGPTGIMMQRSVLTLSELREQARERGSKLAEVYTKASHSLERCPVSYPRPRDLICLAGIGPKTVGILEVKWKKHCEENGLPLIESPDSGLLPPLIRRDLTAGRADGEGQVQSR